VNPYGFHETGPALPFAKTLRVNSFGIHENSVVCRRKQRGYVEAGCSAWRVEPAEAVGGKVKRAGPSFIRASGTPFLRQGKPALPFAKALRVNSFGIHENPVVCRRKQRG
jgi:hypothetical protein